MSDKGEGESRDGVALTNLDQPLFDGADATKRDLIDYLDGVRHRIIPELEGRPLSAIRIHRGQEAFMQKNVPKYTPDWVQTVQFWAETSKRDVTYALCNDRRTLLWFANQRAVEYHPTLVRADRPDRITHLVLDLDPPDADAFSMAVRAARLVRQALAEVGLEGAVKTSGAKGVHVFVPIDDQAPLEDSAAATRAIAARAERLDPKVATTAFMSVTFMIRCGMGSLSASESRCMITMGRLLFAFAVFCAAASDVTHGPAISCGARRMMAAAARMVRFTDTLIRAPQREPRKCYSDFAAVAGDRSVAIFSFSSAYLRAASTNAPNSEEAEFSPLMSSGCHCTPR